MLMESNAKDGAMLSAGRTEIETFTGGFVDVLHPRPDTIKLVDIAHHLAQTCRYNGAVNKFYSVAEHSSLVHDLVVWAMDNMATWRPADAVVFRDWAKGAILHDCAEAYLCDLTAPAKYALRQEQWELTRTPWHGHNVPPEFKGAYTTLGGRMERAVAEQLGVDPRLFDHPLVMLCDMWALKIEAKVLTSTGGANWRWPGELPNDGKLPREVRWTGGLALESARSKFIAKANKLGVSDE